MATERKDGRWQAVVTIANGTKKPTRKFFYGPTEEAAETKANNYYNKYVIGTYTEITFKEYSNKYIQYRSSELAQRTVEYYKDILRLHILPTLGKKLFDDIKPLDIKNLLYSMENKGIGAKTRVNTYLVLHLIMKEAVMDGLIEFNPVANVRKPKYRRKEVTPIPTDDFWIIFNNANQKMKTILYLTWTTGLRVGEVVGLQWGDLNIKNRTLQVSRALTRTRDGLKVKSPKTSYGRRTISIRQELIDMLLELKSDSVFIFTNLYGNMQDPSIVSKQFSKLCENLNLKYNFHQLRHTHATMLGDQGISPKAIQERIGHGSATFTMDVYTHKSEKSQDGIADLDIFDIK